MKAHPALDRGTLAWLIAPLTASEFFENYFEQQPLLVARDQPDYFRNLLTLADVDRALTAIRPNSDEIDLVKRDSPEPIKSEDYIAPNGFADPVRVASLFAAGATIIFPALNRRLPKLADLCAGLEGEFTHPFQTNVYLTPRENQGFKVHYDSHDVFVIQAAGSKTWNFYRTPIELPLHTQSFVPSEHDPGPVTCSFEIKAGDVLYIPRGLMHEARSTDKTSLHITVGVHTYTWNDLMIDAVTAMSLGDPAFRKSLPPGFARMDFDRGDARVFFDELLKRLTDKSKFDTLLDVFADHFVGTREVPLPGQLEAMDPAHKLTMRDVFAPRPHLIYRLARTAGSKHITLRACGIELTLPSTVENAVRFALKHPSYRAGDLPVALSSTDKLTLVARLLREGLIERKGSRTKC
ncbi:cupin domain-containing protein [Bradyrhizobium oligotrophicum]|uniref:cupin domain-containing protein n=1 Tax=Bradyrhizobium oligotrophicum TaxID=44255 RepID=UPI003EB6C685